uniref:Hemerythrin-like domain-containing protein n=1 Tax=Arundo donax TaxID=35708 RepID=A0A0A9CSS7_ARUDO
MGNCSPSPRRRRPSTEPGSPPLHRTASTPSATATTTVTVSPLGLARSPSVSAAAVDAEDGNVVRVYGSDGCPVAWRLRVSLLYKAAAPVHFTPSEAAPLGRPVLRLSAADPEVSGPADELLRQVDARFEGKPRVAPPERPRVSSPAAAAAEEVAELVRLQHRSAERHLEGVAAKVAEMVKKGKKSGKGRSVVEGAEVRRVGKWYGDAMEVMLEHARMEETLLFPDLQRAAHPGVCDKVNEQHGRHLPMMNGIKEDIKTLLTLELGSPLFHEVLVNLSVRLKALQDHTKEHFKEEENELFPRLEAVRRMQREEGKVSDKSSSAWASEAISAMEVTHSKLFPFFMTGLLPQEAVQYLDLVCRCTKNTRHLVSMLRSLAERLEDANPSIIHNNPTKLYEHLLVKSP